MSSIFVQIGQCGCQIGHKLNKKLSNSYYSTRIHPPNKVHSIMIDTQPKVLKPYIDNPPRWLDPGNVKYFQYGRGNNWSYGYMHELPTGKFVTQFIEGHKQFSHLTKKQREQKEQRSIAGSGKKMEQIQQQHRTPRKKSKSPISKRQQNKQDHTPQKSPKPSPKKRPFSFTKHTSLQQPIQQYPSLTQFQQKVLINKYLKQNKQICQYTLQRIRKQLDTTDCLSAINIICSLGGGTGSGLGTKIIQKIYQQFNIDIFAHVVLPNKSGQTPLQIYNCTLSLASIQEHSTAILVYENDNMINTYLSLGSKDSNEGAIVKGTDLDYINDQISDIQARLIKLNDMTEYGKFYNHVISQCVVSKEMKYLALFGSGSGSGSGSGGNNIVQAFDNTFQSLCQQLRVYNQQTYQIDGIVTKRQKCLANSMVVLADNKVYANANTNTNTTANTNNMNNMNSVQLVQQQHRKKLKNIINPVQYNSQLNIEYLQLPKPNKTNTNTNNTMNMSKITTNTNTNTNTNTTGNSLCQISFIMNHSNIIRYLQYLSVAGRKKYNAKAYLWHYKYANLQQAFNCIETTIDQYYYACQE